VIHSLVYSILAVTQTFTSLVLHSFYMVSSETQTPGFTKYTMQREAPPKTYYKQP